MSNKQYQVVGRVELSDAHSPTGRTLHRHGDAIIGKPVALVIATYGPDSGFYLFHMDGEGNEMTDTFHDSVEEAVDQANWEFGVKASEWTIDESK